MAENKKKSDLWKYFDAVINEEKAKCIQCGQLYSYKGGTTSNLRKHLNSKHPLLLLDNKKNKPASSHSQVQPTFRKHSSKNILTRQEEITDLILNMIITDLQPFSVIEDCGFRKLILKMEPAYVFPSRQTFSKSMMPKKFEQTKEALIKVLKSARYITLTTDSWTSMANESYISVTAHFISENWQCETYLLECCSYSKSHTSINLSKDLIRVVENWNIKNQITAIASDNASNIVGAVKLTGWSHIPCFAHTLNLVIQDSLKVIDVLRKKVKTIVEYFHRSTQANNRLIAVQKQMNNNVKVPLKLTNDVVTRWNSTFYMFKRIAELEESVTATVGILHNPVELLTIIEWKTLKECINILLPFEQITTEMSTEQHVSLSKIPNITAGLETVLKTIQKDLKEEISKNLISRVLESLNLRFSKVDTNSLIMKAGFLDPRFKARAFRNEETFNAAKEKIKNELVALLNEKLDNSENETSTPSSSTELTEEKQDKYQDLVWLEFDKTMEKYPMLNQTPLSKAILEIRMYLDDAPLDRKKDPLQDYWKEREKIYPNLANLAKKYLGIVATSVPSERIFSKMGEIISKRRCSLKASNVEKLIFLNKNKKLL